MELGALLPTLHRDCRAVWDKEPPVQLPLLLGH